MVLTSMIFIFINIMIFNIIFDMYFFYLAEMGLHTYLVEQAGRGMNVNVQYPSKFCLDKKIKLSTDVLW